ncbi:D,D-dipeptide ABC transporter permease [Shimia sp.]|jgi:peptide/nickel transport system permease protein|uniref:D,D-dipeptide ABC transporter permease n=1 Tax=unclassified Shimia TaxID=2630038 RepID=UPI0025F6E6AA|nr:D,D-dipeptide ABC transporter permease [Shimia sp.]MCH2068135.1 D,D-dipeptide ABC transporter permease [Shimia sp.]
MSDATVSTNPVKRALSRVDWGYLWYQVKKSPLTLGGGAVVLIVLFLVIFAPVFATHDPNAIDLRARLAAPSWDNFFGTDEVGRDLYSRILYGGRQSVAVGFFVVVVAGSIGTFIGVFAGLIGGRVDVVIMRMMDVVLSVPSLVLIMALAAALGPSLINAAIAIALVRIPVYVRISRGQTLLIREMSFVTAAETFKASKLHILRWHILPNILSPVMVQATLDLGSTILLASALSFIGLGAQQPTAEWGAMVATGRNYILDQWWYSAFPGFAILITATAFNLLGDGIRDILDPKQKAR